jgi:hypothetical protein
MVVFDATSGPEGDNKPKALRRAWYAYFKTRFAQPFSAGLGEDLQSERWGLNWAGRLSTTYAKLVDREDVTYRELWVEDASRMMEKFHGSLFNQCNIVVAVEKDSLFADFTTAAQALGARTVYSGKGKSSKAAIEKLLREHFGWGQDWRDDPDVFTQDSPLIILHISDHDFDGEQVIGPTFAEQARRYTPHVLEARVGIKPEHVDQGLWREKWYQIKLSNSGYVAWAEQKALFLAECVNCNTQWPVVGAWAENCPNCGGVSLMIKVEPGKDGDSAFGFEVEALKTRAYYGLLVDALLQVLPFEYIVSRLRDECKAVAQDAAEQIKDTILADNQSYQDLLAEFDRLEAVKAEFEDRVQNTLTELGEPHTNDWRDTPYSTEQQDPDPVVFRTYVEDANGWAQAWRPFRTGDRTRSLRAHLQTMEWATIQGFADESLDW